MDLNRRQFFILGTSAGLGAAGSAAGENKLHPTPKEIEGPFYPVVAQKDKDFDLTRVEGKEGTAQGQIIEIVGKVVDEEGKPIADATVDLWQANAAGRYRHPHDPNPAPLDENFQGWAIVPSGEQGGFRFKTVLPGAYPAADGWMRPPHIHFKVTKLGFIELITQMYFPGQELNETDRLYKRKSSDEQKLMVATRDENNPNLYNFQIVLQKA